MSGSKSKNSQDTTQSDNRRVIGERAISAEGSVVSVIDGGAFDFGAKVVAGALAFAGSAQRQALDNGVAVGGVLKNAYEDAKGQGALTPYITIGALAMAGIVALAAVKK